MSAPVTDPLERLRVLFVERCRTDLEQLRGLGSDHPDMGGIVHRLAGSAGSFGYPEISKAAAVIDDQARYGPGPAPGDVQTLIEALEKAVAAG